MSASTHDAVEATRNVPMRYSRDVLEDWQMYIV